MLSAHESMMMSVYDITENTISNGGFWPLFTIGNADLKLLTTVFNLSASGKWKLFIVILWQTTKKRYLVEYSNVILWFNG